MRRLLFFGGNGHCAARLDAARACLARAGPGPSGLDIVEVPYPGFEERPRARDLGSFLATVAAAARERDDGRVSAAYATGIGALVALALRARGVLDGVPLVLQGPVLWGLERRWMPRLARAGLASAIPLLVRAAPVRRHFVRRYFLTPPPAAVQAAFFDGYRRCPAAADLFRWCGPAWLRELETALAARPEALGRVEVWWGGRDAVVGPRELRWTERALAVSWPERTFAAWGHYPMIDDPRGWVDTVAAHVDARPARIIGR